MATQVFDPRNDFNFLTEGVATIENGSGLPSSIIIYGEKAFPVAVDEDDNPFIAASIVGDGHLLHIGHEKHLKDAIEGAGDTDRLIRNAVAWMSQGVRSPVIGIENGLGIIKTFLENEGYNVITAEASELSNINVFISTTNTDLADQEDTAVQEFLNGGGGLLTAGHAWWWRSQNQDKSIATDHPGNQILLNSGLMISGEALRVGTANIRDDLEFELLNAVSAKEQLKQHINGGANLSSENLNKAVQTINNAIEVLPFEFEEFYTELRDLRVNIGELIPTAEAPINTIDNPLLAFAASIDSRFANTLPSASITAHESSDRFPGSVEENAERISSSVEIDASYEGRDDGFIYSQAGKDIWRSTGIYAPAGEVISITLPEGAIGLGLSVQIGSHTDELWKKDEWERFPEITRAWQLETNQTEAASSFGGLVYIRVPEGLNLGEITVEIDGGVLAPRYILGETSEPAWLDTIRHYPGPWAEFESDSLIITVPSADAINVDNPEDLMLLWEQVMDMSADLASIEQARVRPERIVFDEQISGGALHSGYPVMGHTHHVDGIIDLDALRAEGNWGAIHELGHNHQWRDWILPGTTEATCNLWSVYISEELLGIDRADAHSNLTDLERAERISTYIDAGANFENDWKVWTALETYLQLQQNFGWAAFKELNNIYYSIDDEDAPSTDQERIDLFVQTFSQVTEKDLGFFFTEWGFPISTETLDSISQYEDWSIDISNPEAQMPEPPEIANVNDGVGSIIGEISNGSSTDDTRPEFTIHADNARSVDVLIDEIVTNDGEESIVKTTLGGSASFVTAGLYSFSPSTDLANGKKYKVRAELTDQEGKQSSFSQAFRVTIDTSAMVPSSLSLAADSDTGSSNSDQLTADRRPTISGIAEAGNSINLYDTDGSTVVGTSSTDANGDWSITTTKLNHGVHAFTAKATDTAGNISDASPALSINIDTVSPEAPSSLEMLDESNSSFSRPDKSSSDESLVEGTVWASPRLISSFDVSLLEIMSRNSSKTVHKFNGDEWIEFTSPVREFIYKFEDDTTLNISVANDCLHDPSLTSFAVAEAFARLPEEMKGDQDYEIVLMNGFGGYYTPHLHNIVLSDDDVLNHRDGYLEELLAHEVAHATLDRSVYSDEGWDQAVANDSGPWISSYAMDNPDTEDLAETIVPWLGIFLDQPSTLFEDSDKEFLLESIKAVPSRYSYIAEILFGVDNFYGHLIEKDWIEFDDIKEAGDALFKVASTSSPTIRGLADAGSLINLYATDASTVVGNTTADDLGNWSISTSALTDGLHSLTAKTIDRVGNSSEASIALGVKIDSTPPIINLPPESINNETASFSINENTTDIHTFTANETSNWNLSGGEDEALFEFDLLTGKLTFRRAQDFENPIDRGDTPENNTYLTTIEAKDAAGNVSEQNIKVIVLDVEENPDENTDDGDASFTITGFPASGERLTASQQTSDPDGDGSQTPRYQWQHSTDGVSWKKRGRGETLKVKDKDINQQIRLRALYQDGEGFSETVFTNVGVVKSGLLLPEFDEQSRFIKRSAAYMLGNMRFRSVVMGSTSKDRLIGTRQNDLMTGGLEKDKLSGGRGKKPDAFLLSIDQLGKQHADVITNFNVKHGDLIALDADSFPNGVNTTFKWVKNNRKVNNAARKDVELIYNKKNGQLFVNANGNESGFGEAGGMIAIFNGKPLLKDNNFEYLELLTP
ncbi:MAG: M60 family metallopeptidase, partial [Prochlorococcus sp.]